MPGHGRKEVLAIQGIEHDRRLGRHGRGARHVPNEGDLAEVVARGELGEWPFVLGHVELTGRDDEEAVSYLTLTDDGGPSVDSKGRKSACDVLE